MGNVIDKILDHPIASILMTIVITEGIAGIVRAARGEPGNPGMVIKFGKDQKPTE